MSKANSPSRAAAVALLLMSAGGLVSLGFIFHDCSFTWGNGRRAPSTEVTPRSHPRFFWGWSALLAAGSLALGHHGVREWRSCRKPPAPRRGKR